MFKLLNIFGGTKMDNPETTIKADLNWEFPGWGKAQNITDLVPSSSVRKRLDQEKKHVLGTWQATAICGNDISSSCLYVSALCAAQAGVLAPVVLLIVALVLYLFRKIYAEVGSALPMNGGTYTVLLNTTNKRMAAAAACLTLLSYVATAVISANEAIHYIHGVFHSLPIDAGTVSLLGVFAILAIVGISESATVALGIFIFHLVSLTLLCVACTIYIVNSPELLFANLSTWHSASIPKALFLGFAAAMLGISGFESSANFIEEQKDGVFPKTLRNMWLVVSIFNPLIAFLALGMLPLAEIQSVPPDLLSAMGANAWNHYLAIGISIDAFLVLSGAILTSFVGVIGLVRRMSLDRCLPQFLLIENKLRRTNHWIVISFFLICTSILFVTKGKIEALAGVYTLSFLSVMALFAIGNMLLKTKRSQLPRDTRASWGSVVLALCFVVIGIIGNIALEPANFQIFLIYYGVVGLAVTIMFTRVLILRVILHVIRKMITRVLNFSNALVEIVVNNLQRINNLGIVYFTAGDNAETLNNAALYVMQNEQTNRLYVVHLYQDEKNIPESLSKNLQMIDRLYPKLRIDFVAIKGTFTPEMIETISEEMKIPKNNMFIGTPGDKFPHRVESLGGVRLIL